MYVPGFMELGNPINATYLPFVYDYKKQYRQAHAEVGIALPVDGFNGEPGAYWIPNSINPGTYTRCGSAEGYLQPVLGRRNLHVLVDAAVTKLIYDIGGHGDVKVKGVEYAASKSAARKVAYGKRIVLSAGAVHSPKILQLSGIGPKALLESLKIPVKVELPGVGQNFQSHIGSSLPWNYTFSESDINLTNVIPFPRNQSFFNEQYALGKRKIGRAHV